MHNIIQPAILCGMQLLTVLTSSCMVDAEEERDKMEDALVDTS